MSFLCDNYDLPVADMCALIRHAARRRCTKAHLELAQQLFNDLVCGHPAGDTNFGRSTEGWSEDRGLKKTKRERER